MIDFGVRSVAAQRWVKFKEIIMREVFLESTGLWVDWGIGLDRTKMPLAKVTCAIASVLKQMGDCYLLGSDGIIPEKNTAAVGMPSSHNAGARR